MAKTGRYDAFISYRHCEPDNGIASRLQKKLEGFRLPKDIAKKVGRTRLTRVFRDETEFAVSDDLTQAINEALINSDFLICICSPEYLKSEWCRKEIEFFLKGHDRKHILLVLADGEPMEAFPPEVLYDDVYKMGPDGRPYWVKVPREPLAADCRGGDSKERNPKIDKAAMRLIASILGINFDDLQQRHRHEEYKRTRNRVLIVFAVMAAFLALSVGFLIRITGQNLEILKQNEEIARQNEIISQKYADTLAQTSDNLLRDSKRKDAVYAARLALNGNDSSGYSELATKALANALGIYDLPNTFGCDSDILLPCNVLGDLVISQNGGYASVKDLDHVRYVVDMNTGATVFSFIEDEDTRFVFDGGRGFVFKRQNENYRYYTISEGTETDLGISEAFLFAGDEGEGYVISSGGIITLYKGAGALGSINCPQEGFTKDIDFDVVVSFVPKTNECWVFLVEYKYKTTTAFIFDMASGSSRRMHIAGELCFGICTDGKSIAWKQYDGFDYSLRIMDIADGTTQNLACGDIYNLIVMNNDVVVISETTVTILDKDLNKRHEFNCGTFVRIFTYGDAVWLLDSTGILYKISDGGYVGFDTGLADNKTSWMKAFRNGRLYASITGDNHIYTYSFRQSDYMTVAEGAYEDLVYDYSDATMIYENPAAASFVELIMKKETEFKQNRIKRVVMCQNADRGLVQLYDGAVFIYDSSTGEKLKTIYSTEGYIRIFYYDSQKNYYYLSSENVDVYDADFKNIYSIRNCVLSGIDRQKGAIVVLDLTYGNSDNVSGYYTVYPVTYEQLIRLADDYLAGYEPDERVKEKYSLE